MNLKNIFIVSSAGSRKMEKLRIFDIYTNEYLFAILQGRAKTTRLTRIYGTTFRIISTTNNKIFGYSLPIV